MATASGFGTLSLPDHCLPKDAFLERISSNFNTCVPTSLAFVSTLLGSLSILSWLFAQLPQIFKNYELKSSSSLSVIFLIVWCFGDSTNLLGALLTKQAAWQVVVAGYYVSVDVVLVSQYFWYTYYRPSREGTLKGQDGHTGGDDDDHNAIVEGLPVSDQSSEVTPVVDGKDKPTPPNSSTRSRQTSSNSYRVNKSRSSSLRSEKDNLKSSCSTITRFQYKSPSLAPSPQTVVFVSTLCAVLANASPVLTSDSVSSTSLSNTELAGRILSWMSTFLYLGSRFPQIYKNYSRRSTSGLASSLFVAAFFGNLFYSTSILTNPLAWSSYPPYGGRGWAGPEGSDRATWIKLAAPFWLGAAGVLTMDAFVGVQFFMYGEEKVIEVSDSKGRRRWKKVNGWMRGWIPSPSLSRRDSQEVESERPLLEEERAEERVGYRTA
ncbi:hypothetical protein MMC14_008862 [Varicellaria rhodocarpa]|nr:hypothetical protein [Varicellaria rhodocarpa]